MWLDWLRWNRAAAGTGYYLQDDDTTGESVWIAAGEDGSQYVQIAHVHSGGWGLFMVEPVDGAWHVTKAPFDLGTEEHYGSLRDALESIAATPAKVA